MSRTPQLKSRAEAGALLRIRNLNIINSVVGHLTQPIPVEPKPHVLAHFVGRRVVGVKGLSRLHVSEVEPRKRIVIG